MLITICTPTYNRKYTLNRVYNSLLQQTNKKFEWIIIDDGSTDDTKKLVKQFMQDNEITVRYYYQKNQGKHVALNKGYKEARGSLLTCLDSDDWLYPDAIETVLSKWNDIFENEKIAGLIALDSYADGKTVGTALPYGKTSINWISLIHKEKMKGDKDYYIKTEILKKYKFPSYKGNKHMPPTYQHYLLSKHYDFLLLNKHTKYVQYLEDGISKNKYNKYIIAPDNFARYRYEIMDLIPSLKKKIINAIHFNASLYLGNIKIIPNKLFNKTIVFVTKPLGYVLSKYIKVKNKKYKS